METRFVDIHTHRSSPEGPSPLTAGIHPWDAAACDPGHLPPLPEGIEAVGEIGLDFSRPVPRDVQTRLFEAQLRQARERNLPVVLHCVRAFEPLMRCLRAEPPRAAIFHGFIGSPEQARTALQQGCYLSYGLRSMCSPRAVAALRATPRERLFFETDDDPRSIREVYEKGAALRGEPVAALAEATLANFERLFGHG